MNTSRTTASALRQLAPRLFTTAAIPCTSAAGSLHMSIIGSVVSAGARALPLLPPFRLVPASAASKRFLSTAVSTCGDGEAAAPKGEEKAVASYWGVAPAKHLKEDGTEWKWNCFKVFNSITQPLIFSLLLKFFIRLQPSDAYSSDLSIDLNKHHVPTTWGDKMARWLVKSLRVPTDIFFQVIKKMKHLISTYFDPFPW